MNQYFLWYLDKICFIGRDYVEIGGWFFGTKDKKIDLFIKLENDILKINTGIVRRDVYNAFKGHQKSLNSGFKKIIKLSKNKNIEIKFLVGFDGKYEEIYSINTQNIDRIHDNYILYCIDGIFFRENVICIAGWAFSKISKNPLKIEILNEGKNVKIEKKESFLREDVYNVHNGFKQARSSGFSIEIKDDFIINKLTLKFKDEDNNYFCFKEINLSKEREKNHKFNYEPKISIIVPAYNTKKEFLVAMIESVRSQTYSNWELCIADGSSERKNIRNILKEYEKKDEKIKVKLLQANKGISGNSNEALKLASGDYIALLDHDDVLKEDAIFEVIKVINENKNVDFIYTDEDKISEDVKERFAPQFKPDWSPDTFRSYNYICHFSVFKKSLLDEVGCYFNSKYDGSQDYDLFLRLIEKARCIVHIPKVLYHWRAHKESTASSIMAKEYAIKAGKKALKEHLDRIGLKGNVNDGMFLGSYKINYEIKANPKVSIIIPNKDHLENLKKCIDSIVKKTTYSNYEIIIVENNSKTKEIFDYYKEIEKKDNIKVVIWKDKFNYSDINNFGVKYSTGEFLILLNNDTEVITPNWIEEMLQFAQREDVGIVGAKLYYPNSTIQHAGVIIGIGSFFVGHSHTSFNKSSVGYMGRLKIVQNLSAVTGACLMVRKDIFEKVGGLDETFKIRFNDIDFCLRVRSLNKLVVWTPYAELYHYEAKSRGLDNTLDDKNIFKQESRQFKNRWNSLLEEGDPYYNKNLTLDRDDFSPR